jgi:hypothetical protein
LNKLPEVKGWINYELPCYGANASVDYVGGDPRMVFSTETTTTCTDASGNVVGEPVVTVKSGNEIDVSGYTPAAINTLMINNGF